jgi:class 3 adenylate cyclase/tetratricopeptide (TPR) repeat protein
MARGPRRVSEERRLVTCMFVDLVGSTDMTMRLGAERLKRELGVAFGELSGIVTAHGGTVQKYVGDAIYAIFGAPIAHEDDTLRALRAADEIRSWCVTSGAKHGHPFTVRMGVETGEAVIDLEAAATTRQQMSVGAVVNIAARLQQRAEPGEVLVGPTAREAAGTAAELEPLAEVDLKGIGMLPIFRLVHVGIGAAPQLPFVGREAELGLLDLALRRAIKGRSVLAVVSGPPGQGKTRLVQEFLRQYAGDAHHIATRCRPADETGVFAPVREILGATTIEALADQIAQLCTDDSECERVVAGLAESAGIATARRSLASLPAAEREDEIVQAWRRYLGLLGTSRLVVLAIDDIHWADAWLVKLIDRLTFSGPRLLVVATARPEFAGSAGIRPSGDRFFIELEGLDAEEAGRLAALAGGGNDRLVERAEGNPLFLVELARAGERDDLPLTLQGALGARLDQLTHSDRRLLSLAAIAGERFSASDAAFVAEADPAEIFASLGRLVDLHFLDASEAGYRFHHGLVRDVAYGRLLTAERMQAHARFARERVHPEDPEGLAYHWWAALRPPDAEWVWAGTVDLPAMRREGFHAHLAAGRRHAEHFAMGQAVELIGRALLLADDDRDRAEAHRALAVAYQRVLRQDEAWSHLRDALALYRPSGGVPVELYVELVNAAKYYGAFRERPTDAEVDAIVAEGRAAAKAAGDARALAAILGAHAHYVVNTQRTEPEAAAGYVEEALAAAEASGDREIERAAVGLKLSFLMHTGRIDEMGRMLEMEREDPDPDSFRKLWHSMHWASYHFAMAHRDANAESVAEVMRLADPMGPHNRTHAWAQATETYVGLGDWEKARDLAQRTAKLVGEETGTAFCSAAAEVLRDGAVGFALGGQADNARMLMGLHVTTDVDPDVALAVPRALLGIPSPESDVKLAGAVWWDAVQAAFRYVILGRPDDAEAALAGIATPAGHSVAYRALADGVAEAIAEMRGGPRATYEALRKIGYLGWVELLERRVDPEHRAVSRVLD